MTSLELAINKLAKWRTVFASWQLGTRIKSDPEAQAIKDHREVTMILRAELNAWGALFIEKGIITQKEFETKLEEAALDLDQAFEKKFPGFSTTQEGVTMKMPEAVRTTAGWRP